MSNLSQKQFSQLKLPLGNVEGSKIKQPHQMSPEEFASHPFAVFHTTHLPTEKVLDADSRFDPGIHLGTDIAASQRHLVTGNKSMTSLTNGKIVEPHTQPATMHVFHHDPGEKLNRIVSDAAANNRGGSIEKQKRNVYYNNSYEDRGNLSLVVHDTSRLKSQHDFVSKAISEGKEGEVHPYTLKLYNSGSLKKGNEVPYSLSRERVLNGMSEERFNLIKYHDEKNYPKLPFEKPEGNHSSNYKFFGQPTGRDKTKPEFRGPNQDVLKKALKDRKKA
jgi:hypothetical protein